MTTRKIVPRADNEGGIGTALKRWASAFINALTANSITVSGLTASLPVSTDANKNLTTITYPKFSAHKNGTNQTGVADSTDTKITYTTETYDIGDGYDAANSKWIPGIIGKASISACVEFTTFTDQLASYIRIHKNGTTYKRTALIGSGTGGLFVWISCDVLVDVITDYFEVYVFQMSGTDKIISGSSASTWFMGHMLP